LKAFLRHTNRNLERDENSDLMHHLHEKQLRHERMMRNSNLFSPASSHVGSHLSSTENIARKPAVVTSLEFFKNY